MGRISKKKRGGGGWRKMVSISKKPQDVKTIKQNKTTHKKGTYKKEHSIRKEPDLLGPFEGLESSQRQPHISTLWHTFHRSCKHNPRKVKKSKNIILGGGG